MRIERKRGRDEDEDEKSQVVLDASSFYKPTQRSLVKIKKSVRGLIF